MSQLFGTDGVRGKANVTLTPKLAYKLGIASALLLEEEMKEKPRILVGKDTRISCDMLESALVAGMCSVGAIIYTVGIIPTPAVAYLLKKYNCTAGVMISASHNPYEDNGIKFFNRYGYKLRDEIEKKIEEKIDKGFKDNNTCVGDEIGYIKNISTGIEEYKEYLKSLIEENIEGVKVVIDCANGATYKVARQLLEELGVDVIVMNDEPNGVNINDKCGSTHMEGLSKKVVEEKAELGLAFDGDGDRCLAVDEKGNFVDGDQILSMLGNKLKESGKLYKKTIVATIMSNLGLLEMGKEKGIKIIKTKVGDRYVLEKMLEGKYNFGGEQSGHVIYLDHNTTGDGLLVGLKLIEMLKEKGLKFSRLNRYMKVMPQILINVEVKKENKMKYLENDKVKHGVEQLEKKYEKKGRVLIRPSGTEDLVRVMIEGNDVEEIEKDAKKLSVIIKSELGD